MNIENRDIADRCRDALKRSGIKNKDLAAKIKKSGATVTDYLSGNTKIPIGVLAEISRMTGEALDLLVFGKIIAGVRPGNTNDEILGTVNESSSQYHAGPLKLSQLEEEIIYKLREMPEDFQEKARDGVHMVWVMAHRKKESVQDNDEKKD